MIWHLSHTAACISPYMSLLFSFTLSARVAVMTMALQRLRLKHTGCEWCVLKQPSPLLSMNNLHTGGTGARRQAFTPLFYFQAQKKKKKEKYPGKFRHNNFPPKKKMPGGDWLLRWGIKLSGIIRIEQMSHISCQGHQYTVRQWLRWTTADPTNNFPLYSLESSVIYTPCSK